MDVLNGAPKNTTSLVKLLTGLEECHLGTTRALATAQMGSGGGRVTYLSSSWSLRDVTRYACRYHGTPYSCVPWLAAHACTYRDDDIEGAKRLIFRCVSRSAYNGGCAGVKGTVGGRAAGHCRKCHIVRYSGTEADHGFTLGIGHGVLAGRARDQRWCGILCTQCSKHFSWVRDDRGLAPR